jgi:monoamine oxidase
MSNSTLIESKTVIIGAGASGLSAAFNLLQNDYKDFYLLEALDRIGGRCHTVDLGNSNNQIISTKI